MAAALRRRAGALAFFAVAAAVPLAVRDQFFLDTLILILLWGALSAAWNVAGGYAGQVSLGHAAFFGLGAYSVAVLAVRWNLSVWAGLAVGALLSTLAGLVIGYLSNRLRGPYFALATIAFAQVLLIVASRWRGLTKGSEGIPVPFRPGFATLGFASKVSWLYLALAFAVLVWLVEVYLERSRAGYQLAGVREDEEAAQALGIASRRLKVLAVAVSAALTSFGGALWAAYIGFVDPFYVFSLDLSILFALNAIIGGTGTAVGPFLGSLLITSLETYLRAQFAGVRSGFTGLYLIIYGCLLIVFVRFLPQGLAGALASVGRKRMAGPAPRTADAA
jgi:branched-chain amino acid transport system permease protein